MSRVIIYAKHFTTKRSCASPEKDLVNESPFIFCLDANLYYKCLRRITISNSIRQDALEEHDSLELQSKNHRPMTNAYVSLQTKHTLVNLTSGLRFILVIQGIGEKNK